MTRITVHIKPGSKKPGIEKNTDGSYTVRVKEPPVEGKANQALIESLAKEFSIPRTSIQIHKGTKSRTKIIEIPEQNH